MKFDSFNIRYIDELEFNVLAVGFRFEVMEDLEDIIVDVYTVGTFYFNFGVFG